MNCTIKRFNTGMHYVRISNYKALEFLENGQKRVIVDVNNRMKLHCAIMKSKEDGYFIYIGSKALNELELKEGDDIYIEINEDNSDLKFDYPEEFQEVLDTDIEAKQVFNTLTDGNKRSIIYLVTRIKSINKRIEKSLKIAEQLKIGVTSARKMKF